MKILIPDWSDKEWIQTLSTFSRYIRILTFLLQLSPGHQIAVTPAQREVLSLFSAHVTRLLQKAVAYGPVFIVTAAEFGWVEMSAALYMPDVQSVLALSNVHIVSARSW